ncbi:MAG TPA: type VI secretion system lipoprotein TssJ [Polyangiaceae bacterium]|nr:type VI secretion system lipoprotein TssJ [Polyangiaceae bacterium]
MIDSRRPRAALALARAAALCASLLAVGCGGAQLPRCGTSEAIALHVHSAAHLNPDRAGLPRSVVVRVYQLGDARTFSSSSFERLWTGAAGGLPTPEQLTALPGRNQDHSLPRDPAAQYLAIAANFREREGDSGWRALVRLPTAQNACERWVSGHPAPIELVLADYSLYLR